MKLQQLSMRGQIDGTAVDCVCEPGQPVRAGKERRRRRRGAGLSVGLKLGGEPQQFFASWRHDDTVMPGSGMSVAWV